jgi:polyhydroxyalkanoate synthesis regulator phasin
MIERMHISADPETREVMDRVVQDLQVAFGGKPAWADDLESVLADKLASSASAADVNALRVEIAGLRDQVAELQRSVSGLSSAMETLMSQVKQPARTLQQLQDSVLRLCSASGTPRLPGE